MTDDQVPTEFANLNAQLMRVYGDVNDKRFMLLPFNSFDECADFLRTVPDGAGPDGVMIALNERLLSKPCVQSPQADLPES